jgi:hypothetical protein
VSRRCPTYAILRLCHSRVLQGASFSSYARKEADQRMGLLDLRFVSFQFEAAASGKEGSRLLPRSIRYRLPACVPA